MRLAVVAVAALALAATACGGDDEARPLPEGRSFAASGSIAPRVQLFGDEVAARVELIVDRERFDPARIRVAPAFEPYEIEGEPEREVRGLGDFAHVRYGYRLRCLSYDCLEHVGGGPPQLQPGGLPPTGQSGGFGERASLRLDPARVLYDKPEGGTEELTTVSWPELQSVSRVNFADTDVIGFGFPFEASVTPLLAASYRAPPAFLGGVFVVGGLALLGLGGLVVTRLRGRDESVVVEEAPPLPPLEQALRRVEAAREEPETERRESLEVLAWELELSTAASPLIAEARRLAWTRPEPDSDAMSALAGAVRRTGAANT